MKQKSLGALSDDMPRKEDTGIAASHLLLAPFSNHRYYCLCFHKQKKKNIKSGGA